MTHARIPALALAAAAAAVLTAMAFAPAAAAAVGASTEGISSTDAWPVKAPTAGVAVQAHCMSSGILVTPAAERVFISV
jgi:hypothetical protein